MSTPLLARDAPGLLGEFAAAGILAPADVHVARRLGALAGETDDRVLLAVALTVRGTRSGSVVLDLETAAATVTADVDTDAEPAPGVVTAAADLPWPDPEPWTVACSTSPLTRGGDDPDDAPVRQVGPRLWLDRYWQQEKQVAGELRARAARLFLDLDLDRLRADLAALFPGADEQDQRAACDVVASRPFGVVAGGPGTGKTTTVARLLTAIYRQQPGLRIALAAPTASAAARLEDAVHRATGPLSDVDRRRLQELQASTLHRLLGWRRSSSRFRHGRDNRLPFEVVVVDESSMVPLTMMARLLEALGPDTRLILLGDPDQLASVEAGAVLGDIVAGATTAADSPLAGAVATLGRVHRFDAEGSIARLAGAVREGRTDDVLELLHDAPDAIRFVETPDDGVLTGDALTELRSLVDRTRAVVDHARAGDAEQALHALEAHRLLCVHRRGPRGERWWAEQVERWLLGDHPSLVPRLDGRYAGQPLMVTANDYENNVFNGDTGVVVERDGDLAAAFRRGAATFTLPLTRLGDVRPLYAMTVHKAQGNQYREVTLLLPPADSPLATRQTFYTAVTRASTLVRVVGSVDAVRACVERQAARATGLRDRLADA
ncbi:exodeoxyribonuclease V subunit alpha [Jatrophihabitans sp. YIM 134969]